MFGKEPTVILGALAEVIKSIIPMLIIFGFISWTGEQVAQVMIVVSVGIAFFNILLARSQVYSPESAKTALAMPQGSNMTLLDDVLAAGVKVAPGDTIHELAGKVDRAEAAIR